MYSCLVAACGHLEEILQAAKDKDKKKPLTADDVPNNMFHPAIAVYKDLYENMSVTTTEAFEEELNCKNDVDVQKAISKLRDLEAEWNKFLTSLDPEAAENEKKDIFEGEIIPGPVNLLNASFMEWVGVWGGSG